ncbi:MAG: NYN domain-containing protein, partial [Bacteroidia bacterium]
KEMMEEIAKYGTPTFKRIYGDWTQPNLGGWKRVLLENAITPIQQYGYTKGKNSTDSNMIIDAMDILYSEKVDGFCIVSSDSDFTRLATRLREAGMLVIGLGEKKTPNPFIVACDKFIYLEILKVPEEVAEVSSHGGKNQKKKKIETKEALQKIGHDTIQLISTSITSLGDDSGWAFLGDVGNLILKKQPAFDPRNFGYMKLALLLKSIGKFEIDERATDNKSIKLVYVRVK